ncbi:MAG: hypothetical protein WD314_13690 [Trueperaceae bacterium]
MNTGSLPSRATFALLALLLFTSATATSYRELSLQEIFTATEVGFVATVASSSVEMRGDMPWTVVEFEVQRWLAGDGAENRVRLAFLGGSRPGGASLQVNLMPGFEVGERVMVLAYDEEYYSPIVGFNQGVWRLRDQALLDAQGRQLSLADDGRLLADGPGVEPQLVIDAVARELEARQ